MQAHYLYYPVGGFFKKHRDNTAKRDGGFRALGRTETYFERREFSVILYLNDDWTKKDGGQLRIYHRDGRTVDVLPKGGTLVLFRSDAIPHEVLPGHRIRWAVVAWYPTIRARQAVERSHRFTNLLHAASTWHTIGFPHTAAALLDRLAAPIASLAPLDDLQVQATANARAAIPVPLPTEPSSRWRFWRRFLFPWRRPRPLKKN